MGVVFLKTLSGVFYFFYVVKMAAVDRVIGAQIMFEASFYATDVMGVKFGS